MGTSGEWTGRGADPWKMEVCTWSIPGATSSHRSSPRHYPR